MIKTSLSFTLVTLMMNVLIASPIIFESNFDSDNSSIIGWSENTQISRAKDGNQFLQGASIDHTGKAKAIASLNFSPVKGNLSLEFKFRAFEEKNWSTFLSFRQGEFELFRLLTINNRLQLETIAGASSYKLINKKRLGSWIKVRLEMTTDKEMNNLIAYVNNRIVGIYSVPSLYQQKIDQIAFGRLARIDDLKIMSGEKAFVMPENPNQYVFLNDIAVKQRRSSKAIPEETDPLSLFLDRSIPTVIKNFGEETLNGITVRKFTYLARPAKPEYDLLKSEVYAIIAEPSTPGSYPGLLILHGGGGVAEEKRVIAWAKEGYVAMSISQPGVAHPSKSIYAEGIVRFPYGFNRFSASPDAASSPLMDAFIAGVKAFQLLEVQPKVDSSRIGLTGISWGGFTSTAIAGLLGDRLKAAFAVYGCGFLEHSAIATHINKMEGAERDMWLRYVDAGRRAYNIRAPYFIVGATNDSHYQPISIERTLEAIPGPTNQLLAPNESHRASYPGGTLIKEKPGYVAMETQYFAYHLKNKGGPFPKIVIGKNNSDAKRVQFTLEGPEVFYTPKVFYTIDVNPDWRERNWKETEVKKIQENFYSAILPENGSEGVYWFALVSDQRDLTVSSRLQYHKEK